MCVAVIVEDDKKIASLVVRGMEQAGFAVDHAEEGRVGRALWPRQQFLTHRRLARREGRPSRGGGRRLGPQATP